MPRQIYAPVHPLAFAGPRRGALGAQNTLFQAPGLMRHTIDAFDTRGFANITSVYAVPTTPGRCRAFVRQPFKFKSKLIPLVFDISPKWLGACLGSHSRSLDWE